MNNNYYDDYKEDEYYTEEEQYFEHSGCAGIVVACICIAIIFIVAVGIKLFAR